VVLLAIGDIIVGVDIGTSKVSTIIGQVNPSNQIQILGYSTVSCTGVKKGIIVDIENAALSIRQSIRQAEQMANLTVYSCYINISGSNVSLLNSKGSVDISNSQKGVTYGDIERAFRLAKDIKIPQDKKVIDIIPYQYTIDDFNQIVDPIGMKGTILEVDCQIVAGTVSSVQNLINCVEKAGYYIDGFIIQAIAAGDVLLTNDEKELGVAMIDVGAGMIDISVFKGKRLIFCNSIQIGGDHITNDIAIGLKVPYNDADKMKKQYGIALTSLIDNDQQISIASIDESKVRNINISQVIEIIEARVHEIFALVNDTLEQQGIKSGILTGAVLTGEGITNYDGILTLGKEILGMPVRNASTKGTNIPKPFYSVAYGIVKYISGVKHIKDCSSSIKGIKKKKYIDESSKWQVFINRVKLFFEDLF
jgi:cell division protein FtsA